MKNGVLILFIIVSLFSFSQNINKLKNQIIEAEDKAQEYYNLGNFKESENYYLKAKQIARENKNLSLELDITNHYINKFINISSVSKNLEMILELKELIREKGNDTLLFDIYTLNIQQYVMLGTKKELRKIMADSLLSIALRLNDKSKLAMAYFNLGTSKDGDEAITYYRKALLMWLVTKGLKALYIII